jgi:hypothetical protein
VKTSSFGDSTDSVASIFEPVFIIEIMYSTELETNQFNQNIDLDSSKPRVDIHLRAFCEMFDLYSKCLFVWCSIFLVL